MSEEIPFKDKIKSINFGTPAKPKETVDADGNKRTQHILDTTGDVNGWMTEHASGRVDAQIFADAPCLNPEMPPLQPVLPE